MSLLPIRRAIVVDREASNLLFAAEALKVLGVLDVETFQGAAVALKRLSETSFDLAFVDLQTLQIPASTRREATIYVAMHPKLPGSDPWMYMKTLGDGADALIEKPFTKGMLLRKLEEVLAGPAGRRLKVVVLRPPLHRATSFGTRGFGGSPPVFDPI